MPRQPRYFIKGLPQHVIQRGVDRQAVFFDERDYQLYLECLGEASSHTDCDVHAYVLMTNHVHLLVTPRQEKSLPRLMQQMGRTYVQTVNRIYKRTGTLWQGRYKASLVDSTNYLLTCYRYIELNPVRAGMVATPDAYRHSSYSHNAGLSADPIITEHAEYRNLGSSREERGTEYRRLFESMMPMQTVDAIRRVTNACEVMGNSLFKDQIENMLGRSVRPGRAGRPKKTSD